MILQDKIIVFWQLIVSPHMAGLAKSMADLGWSVHYVAQELMSEDRKSQGWISPKLDGINFHQVASVNEAQKLLLSLPTNAIHLCQGFRGNGYVSKVQKKMMQCGFKYWVIMETIDDPGLLGIVKRTAYKLLIAKHKKYLAGILASGHKTRAWLINQGADESKVFSFAYFLPKSINFITAREKLEERNEVFRFAFIGRLVEQKRVNLLLSVFTTLNDGKLELLIVGNGPLEAELKNQAESQDDNNIRWLGVVPMSEIPSFLSTVDCLVLPSRHDGWGAVVSEALLSGTRVICSDACGVAGVVRASGHGRVFNAESKSDLALAMNAEIERGCIVSSERVQISNWARCLSADVGAQYLSKIILYSIGMEVEHPLVPWALQNHEVL